MVLFRYIKIMYSSNLKFVCFNLKQDIEDLKYKYLKVYKLY